MFRCSKNNAWQLNFNVYHHLDDDDNTCQHIGNRADAEGCGYAIF